MGQSSGGFTAIIPFINDPMFSDLISSLGLVAKKSGIFTAVLPL